MSDSEYPIGRAEKKNIMAVYMILCLMVIFGFVPNFLFAVLVLLTFSILLPIAGHIRRKAAPASLTANHMTWIIRTVWIGTLLAAVTLLAGTGYVLSVYDPSPLQSCVDRLTIAVQAGNEPGADLFNPCMASFMKVNQRTFLIAGVGAGLPVLLFMLWRVTKGIVHARRSERIENAESWL
jgi:uncharacterized membrane protein